MQRTSQNDIANIAIWKNSLRELDFDQIKAHRHRKQQNKTAKLIRKATAAAQVVPESRKYDMEVLERNDLAALPMQLHVFHSRPVIPYNAPRNILNYPGLFPQNIFTGLSVDLRRDCRG